MRLTLLISLIVALGLPGFAHAINKQNRALLEEHFKSRGQVEYQLYTPLGGPEIGGAVLKSSAESGQTETLVCRVDKGSIQTVYTQMMRHHGARPPFTFLMTGQHMLTYPTTEWTDERGRRHQRGDLQIYDLAAEGGPKVIFTMADVCDVAVGPVGPEATINLLWQPSPHFLNREGVLPTKYSYTRLIYDEATREYVLRNHIETLSEAGSLDAANLNNRAVFYYQMGNLQEAASLLERAAIAAEYDQTTVLHNQSMIKGEIAELEQQHDLAPDTPWDEARMYFFQGDYTAVVRIMTDRLTQTSNPDDLAMLGIALAHKKRWPEADGVTIQLEKLAPNYFTDYLYEMFQIALYQGHPNVASAYLKVLEIEDRTQPGFAAGTAELQSRAGQNAEAKSTLEKYLSAHASSERDLQPARFQLFRIYYAAGNIAGCEQLMREALRGPVVRIANYTDLADYTDLSSSLSDIPLDTTDRMEAPEQPLEDFHYHE